MNEQLPVTRRDALIAASAATALGFVASTANAGDKPDSSDPKAGGDQSRKAPPLKLKVTLTDGQIVTLNATELVIDYGESGKLLLQPNGFLPDPNKEKFGQKPDPTKPH